MKYMIHLTVRNLLTILFEQTPLQKAMNVGSEE